MATLQVHLDQPWSPENLQEEHMALSVNRCQKTTKPEHPLFNRTLLNSNQTS